MTATRVSGLNPNGIDDPELIWLARLELRLRPDAEGYSHGYRGAFTTVLVRCESAKQFIHEASEHLDRWGYEIVGVEELAPLGLRRFELNETMKTLVEKLREYPLQCTAIHQFKSDA